MAAADGVRQLSKLCFCSYAETYSYIVVSFVQMRLCNVFGTSESKMLL
jgi:hypothetical protein